MAELKNGCPPENAEFKEAVCVDAGRVYDSCCEQNTTIYIFLKILQCTQKQNYNS